MDERGPREWVGCFWMDSWKKEKQRRSKNGGCAAAAAVVDWRRVGMRIRKFLCDPRIEQQERS